MANPTMLSYRHLPGTGPFVIPSPGMGKTSVLIRYTNDGSDGIVYYTVAYSVGTVPAVTVNLSTSTDWLVLVDLPGGVGTDPALIADIWSTDPAAAKAAAAAEAVAHTEHPDDGQPPPPGPVRGGSRT